MSDTDDRGRARRYVYGHQGGGNATPHLEPRTAFACRLSRLMLYGPAGPLRQIDLVRRARELGVPLTAATVNHLVTGASDPTLGTLGKLAVVLGVPMAELVSLEVGAPRGASTARLTRVVWNGYGFASDGEPVDVPTLILPKRAGQRLAAVEFDEDLLVVDLSQREPTNGALMLITRDPHSTVLLLMRSYPEADGVRYADASGYVLADASVSQVEVVAVLSQVKRTPGDGPRSEAVRREELMAL